MLNSLTDIINKITPPDEEAIRRASDRQAALAKPPRSLGTLEDISIKLAGITGQVCTSLPKKRIIVLCADNGVTEEGVSSAPVTVTAAQAMNMTHHLTGMSSMAAHFGDEVQVVDMGIATPYDNDRILNRRIMPGTNNIAKGPAMTQDDAVKAVLTGLDLVRMASEEGVNMLGVGEMGIGNTTTSAAVLCALTGLSAEEIAGVGGGLTKEAFQHKKEIIRQALDINQPDRMDVIDVIAKVGGLDIAAMCGVFLGASLYRKPAVIDGFISIVAALCAYRLAPLSKEFMFTSHASLEKGYSVAAHELGLKPLFDLEMRLGEGSGCVPAFRIIDAACAAMSGMALFGDDSGINDGYLTEIRKEEGFSR